MTEYYLVDAEALQQQTLFANRETLDEALKYACSLAPKNQKAEMIVGCMVVLNTFKKLVVENSTNATILNTEEPKL